ncbi:hypothetical protein OG215_15310 [Streptomyces globisporus]|uniref:hypothetical protein n=1 Tax=Streptomyces globisporus TaxID=1908 RepID=UPI00386A9EE9|nr:hypothetical protein OG215_15310 [Streptomyces globisporus]
MTDRTLTPGPMSVLIDDVRDHGYAIVQTRIERAPARYRGAVCADPDGCGQDAVLLTLAVDDVIEDGQAAGLSFARCDGAILRVPVCNNHRVEASHDLFYVLTGRTRPDGIRAFDLPGQHLDWS